MASQTLAGKNLHLFRGSSINSDQKVAFSQNMQNFEKWNQLIKDLKENPKQVMDLVTVSGQESKTRRLEAFCKPNKLDT